MDELYKEHILTHYRNPRNNYILPNADIMGKEVNTLCGDEITVYANIDENETVTGMTFTGEGCAISIAAASLFTDYVYDKQKESVIQMTQHDMEALLGIPVSIVRARCALLPLQAFKNCSKPSLEQREI
jgi:nitrogen fixation protein NifU and related proteins